MGQYSHPRPGGAERGYHAQDAMARYRLLLLVVLPFITAGSVAAAGEDNPYAHFQVANDYVCHPRSVATSSRPWLRDFEKRMTMYNTDGCAEAERAMKAFLANGYACDDLHSYDVVGAHFVPTPSCPKTTIR